MKKSQQDLTRGSVAGQLVRYAAPLVISSLLQALYSMADMVIAGHFIGERALSAITNASQLIFVITNAAIGLATGGSIIIGQYYGAGDSESQKKASGTLAALSLLLGVAASAGLLLFARPMLLMLGAPSMEEALRYLYLCAAGMVPVFLYNAFSAVLRSVGNSRQPFQFIAVSAVLNVLLDLLFMGVFSMGTGGAALATVCSQIVSFLLTLAYLLRHDEIMEFRWEMLKIRREYLFLTLKLGIPSVMQLTIGSLSWLTVTALINSYGVTVSAGNGVSIKIKDFCQLFIGAMSNAATTMVAQNLGAGLFDRAKRVMITTMKITVAMSVVIILLVELLAPVLVSVFTVDPAVAAAAVVNLRIEIVGQVFYAIFFVYHALAIGAGHTFFAMGSSFVNCIVFRVVLAITFNHLFGLNGIYLACMIAPSISVPIGWLYTRSGIWKRRLI